MTAAVYVVEAAFCCALVYVGLVFLRGLGIVGFARIALSFVAGALVYVASLVVLVVGGLPSTPVVALAVALCVAVGVRLATRRSRDPGSDAATAGAGHAGADGRAHAGAGHGATARWVGEARDGLVALAAGAIVVLALPAVDSVTYIKHVDSFEYIAISGMLTAGTLDEGVSRAQLQKRQLVVPALHAPARHADAYYLRSVTPATAASVLLVIVLLVVASARGGPGVAPRPWPVTLLVALIGVGLLVTHNRFVMHAFYVNGHLFYGLLTVVVAGAAWLVARRSVAAVAGWSAVAGLAMAVLQVTRVEGFVLSTALLVAMLTWSRLPLVFKAANLVGYALGVVVWHGFLYGRGASGLDVVAPLAVGVAALIAVATLRVTEPLVVRHRRWLGGLYLAGLVACLGAFAIREPAILVDSWRAFVANAVAADGFWGVGLVSVAVVTLAAWLLLRERDRWLLGLSVLAFMPQAFLIAYLRDAAYRVGGGDSLNRMLIQIVPLMVAFVVVSLQAMHERRVARPAAGGPATVGVVAGGADAPEVARS